VITGDLRLAIAKAINAAGLPGADPGLRPTGTPGQYASSVALAAPGTPQATAAHLADQIRDEPWIESAEVTGPGFLTVTVTLEALTSLAERIISAGPGCATSSALHGQTVHVPENIDPLTAATWEAAAAALAAQLTARLAAAAGATVEHQGAMERGEHSPPAPMSRLPRQALLPEPQRASPALSLQQATAFAGPDAVRFWLARTAPGQPIPADPLIMARRLPGNPAYAVRYAHARAACGVRWAASRGAETLGTQPEPPCPPAGQAEWVLLDALSWLPERVATAARRGRPDEFARYLEELARAVLDALPGSDRLALAAAARTGLAAGLDLLGVNAPDRL
jgi:arginyl-tRNA synthetase